MCTDPFCSLILLAVTIARVAYANGIHPIDFVDVCIGRILLWCMYRRQLALTIYYRGLPLVMMW